jgi:hypothetical protein
VRRILWSDFKENGHARSRRIDCERLRRCADENPELEGDIFFMAKIAKTADRKKVMDTSKSTDCPKCSKPTRIVKRVKDRERGVPGGVYISCSACEFHEKL